MNALHQWFAKQGGFSHWVAGVFATLMLAYASVPQFHDLVNQIHAALPSWAQEAASTAVILYAWYRKPKPAQDAPESKEQV